MPELLTSTSTPPSVSASSSITSAAPGRSSRSSLRTSARRPALSTSRAVSRAPSSSSCHVTPTSWPVRASATAVAFPMPESEPVTIATGTKRAISGAAARETALRGRELEPAEALDAEPVAIVAAHEHEQNGVATPAANDEAGRFDVRAGLAERGDAAAPVAAASRSRQLEREHLARAFRLRRFRPVPPRSPPCRPESLGPDAVGRVAELDEGRRDRLDERRRAAYERRADPARGPTRPRASSSASTRRRERRRRLLARERQHGRRPPSASSSSR